MRHKTISPWRTPYVFLNTVRKRCRSIRTRSCTTSLYDATARATCCVNSKSDMRRHSLRQRLLIYKFFAMLASAMKLIFQASPVSIVSSPVSIVPLTWSYARFTLADPMPRLRSDVVGGSGRNHPTSRRHTIHIGRMARNVSIRVGWYEGVVQYCTTPWLVR